jgi:hypothetical protein
MDDIGSSLHDTSLIPAFDFDFADSSVAAPTLSTALPTLTSLEPTPTLAAAPPSTSSPSVVPPAAEPISTALAPKEGQPLVSALQAEPQRPDTFTLRLGEGEMPIDNDDAGDFGLDHANL